LRSIQVSGPCRALQCRSYCGLVVIAQTQYFVSNQIYFNQSQLFSTFLCGLPCLSYRPNCKAGHNLTRSPNCKRYYTHIVCSLERSVHSHCVRLSLSLCNSLSLSLISSLCSSDADTSDCINIPDNFRSLSKACAGEGCLARTAIYTSAKAAPPQPAPLTVSAPPRAAVWDSVGCGVPPGSALPWV
jgi:hypothetical protein